MVGERGTAMGGAVGGGVTVSGPVSSILVIPLNCSVQGSDAVGRGSGVNTNPPENPPP